MSALRRRSARLVALYLSAGLLTSWGCNEQNPPPTPQESHLKALAVCYGKFIQQNKGQPPKDEAEFKAFIQKLGPSQIPGGAADLDSLFISPRDRQPYVVRYGLDRSQMMPGPNMPVVAYEQTGLEGKRYVADMVGGVREVDEAKFKELVPDVSASTAS